MPLYGKGDKVRYVGNNLDHQEATVTGIKVFRSEEHDRPIYYIKLDGWEEPYKYGIHECNLILIKKRAPNWEV
ncbi:MAG: hypothetical protein GWN64_14780 [Candidatus Thorarchaeota archaeon]|nr:hypothetical protein [Candidatus Thorarchaeota archaeon]